MTIQRYREFLHRIEVCKTNCDDETDVDSLLKSLREGEKQMLKYMEDYHWDTQEENLQYFVETDWGSIFLCLYKLEGKEQFGVRLEAEEKKLRDRGQKEKLLYEKLKKKYGE